jgi:hypothetical protein
MGADIHMSVEVLKANSLDSRNDYWYPVGPIFKYGYYDAERDFPWEQFTEEPYTGRNYDLFGFLGNVRNGLGFAGHKTGEPIMPLSDCRGWPDNCWSAFRDRHGNGKDDGNYHSHSYLTLTELLAANWEMQKTSCMYVEKADYLTYKETGELPEMGWSWRTGGNNLDVTEAQYEAMTPAEQEAVSGIEIEWSQPIRERVGSFYTETLPALRDLLSLPQLKKVARWEGSGAMRKKIEKTIEPSTDQVRVIFCFDS